jgi:hypothetical protein
MTDPAPTEPGQDAEDPMVAVETFLRRNRKEAEDSIQALSREAEALRARLSKVEAALARWQSVAGALNPGQKWGQPDRPPEQGPEPPPIDTAPRPEGGPQTVPEPSLTPASPSAPLLPEVPSPPR